MGRAILIFGSRTVESVHSLFGALDEMPWPEDEITMVIGGEAEGADFLGKQWAAAKNLPYQGFPADWSDIPEGTPEHNVGRGRHGRYLKAAGHIRNRKMCEVLQALRRQGEEVCALCIMEKGGSKGSMGMLGLLRDAGIPVFTKEVTV